MLISKRLKELLKCAGLLILLAGLTWLYIKLLNHSYNDYIKCFCGVGIGTLIKLSSDMVSDYIRKNVKNNKDTTHI